MIKAFSRALVCTLIATYGSTLPAIEVILTRVPQGGLQPQALVGADGTVHLVYFHGEPAGGDLFYTRRALGSDQFSEPRQVNTEANTAIAVGTIRGPQLALGRAGRVHVAWNGSGKASLHTGAPMFYTRQTGDGNVFEPQRDLMTFTSGLDGGGSVAADNEGNVYVAWHGQPNEQSRGETNRAVFVAISVDEGRTFGQEHAVNPEPTGACGCCGMKAFAAADGSLYLLYREARGGVERGATILVSRDHAATFRSLFTHPWHTTTCPMSSAWLGPGAGQTLAAWETLGHVWCAGIDLQADKVGIPFGPPVGTPNQKHPIAIANAKGEMLLIWTEGTRWMKGGSVAWQVFDSAGKPTAAKGRASGLPIWSLATAVARPNGDFEILY